MHTSDHAPMIGARCANYGYRPWTNGRQDKPRPWTTFERRIAKIAERDMIADDLVAELTTEVIAEHAIEPVVIEPEPWSSITDLDSWLECWDDWDHDPFPYGDPDECPFTFAEAIACGDIDPDEIGYVDISCATDRDGVPGWGTHLDFEDLAGLTITNRPYGFSGYGQRDR